jgi:hypothetical protein
MTAPALIALPACMHIIHAMTGYTFRTGFFVDNRTTVTGSAGYLFVTSP